MSDIPQQPARENWLVASGQLDPSALVTLLQLDSGQIVSVPTSLLLTAEATVPSVSSAAEESIVIPVLAEELVVSKRIVPKETIRIETHTETRLEREGVELLTEAFEVTRVPIGREVEARSEAYREGETSVFPVYEERVIARKALFLLEEVRITRTTVHHMQAIEEELCRDVVTIEKTQA